LDRKIVRGGIKAKIGCRETRTFKKKSKAVREKERARLPAFQKNGKRDNNQQRGRKRRLPFASGEIIGNEKKGFKGRFVKKVQVS